MLCAFVKCAMVSAKRPKFLLFSTAQVRNEYLRSYLNCCTIVNLKTRKRSNTLKGSQRMGDGRIFLKNRLASLFNDDLSNEPNFGRIHLAGQCLRISGPENGLIWIWNLFQLGFIGSTWQNLCLISFAWLTVVLSVYVQVADFGGSMVLQPTILIMARPGNEYLLDPGFSCL